MLVGAKFDLYDTLPFQGVQFLMNIMDLSCHM